ncbi:MAG: GNAT family N-acetyltransferase [Cloacibacillus sp.]
MKGTYKDESTMMIRKYNSKDVAALAALFYDTVHSVNVKDYTKEQVDVWATGRVDLEAWDRSFLSRCALVAEIGGTIVGFADMDEDGCLDRLYVHKDYQRRGVACALVAELEGYAEANNIAAVTTYASITALPFFEKRGYAVERENIVDRDGVLLKNYKMTKRTVEITIIEERSKELIEELVSLWQASVRQSHLFLTDGDIEKLTPLVQEALSAVPVLAVAFSGGRAAGFMGAAEDKIEMLFLAPAWFGKGLGSRFVKKAIHEFHVKFVDCNEQNPAAVKFYEKMGFKTFCRSEVDEQGAAFPILKMKLKGKSQKPSSCLSY